MPRRARKRGSECASLGDPPIRDALVSRLMRQHAGEDALIVHELGVLQGEARVDIAVINGSIHGYEIKSDRDTLYRLPGQIAAYSKVLDFVTIVTSLGHLAEVKREVPFWWGIEVAQEGRSQLALRRVRKARRSPERVPAAVAQLLWRDEALDLLQNLNAALGMKRKPRKVLWDTLAEILPPNQLSDAVRVALMKRSNWREANTYVRPS